MFDLDLQIVPGPPDAVTKRQVLEQWMRNPFLDEDVHLLSLRLGIPTTEIGPALQGLCQARFLRNGTSAGYVLHMDLTSDSIAPSEPDAQLVEDVAAASFTAADLLLVDDSTQEEADLGEAVADRTSQKGSPPLKIPQGLEAILSGADAAFEKLVGAMPFGIVVLQGNGSLELANGKALQWLDMPVDLLDGATFEIATGINPLPVARGEAPVNFSLPSPHPVEVSMHVCQLSSGPGVLIALRDVSLQEEVSRMQGEVQEELFHRLRQEMVSPLFMIERFLDHPDAAGLGQARAAMEQINWFFKTYLLGMEAE